MVLIVDNFDSFTYNLYNYFLRLGAKTIVKNRDEIDIDYIKKFNPSHIVLSPGPGRPTDDKILFEIIDNFKDTKKILGVCLGHQAIGMYFGARLIKARKPIHGIVDTIEHDGQGIFKGLKSPLEVTRYHSLILEKDSMNVRELIISAITKNDEVMGIRHRFYQIEGVQFHPESIATEDGLLMIENFLRG
ncbi:aminodeoxychorismate/anthranilate synthase component II [Thermoanaerobacter sp. CM-CNRG TB177]|jgi:para-aminobenzoate synthetase component 2|uniref:anthranilate synthase component II n=1 Tax=unclassified Thermoanaerobacter TaxID=2636821 RepID=UPI0000E1E084|nr:MULTISPECIES: aminodeoxychorismate/anthranilate synthase component II [unclassified Thermoanaerobacter]KUJ91168.1 MAG: glutamine amidotransferase of anthranilate synthase [Thermoanaerobacter thermocopriae]KUK34738.1 MAG: Glutamine amidotransferase of anthranilate synthase [Caldanaerobacter subterraneus]MDK2814509.1 para-aminobenzoate synthetase component [Thermoanaerobacter sp.]ABY91922.1 glutamine amidotransferase of anthranilate synthase [Thermoanaerobacter sp. X514]MBT1278492.1 aminodeox